MKKKVCILNYGSGNVGSVFNMLQFMGYDCNISNEENEIKNSTHIILPGVGSFGSAMKKITSLLPLKILEKEIFNNKKPFLKVESVEIGAENPPPLVDLALNKGGVFGVSAQIVTIWFLLGRVFE